MPLHYSFMPNLSVIPVNDVSHPCQRCQSSLQLLSVITALLAMTFVGAHRDMDNNNSNNNNNNNNNNNYDNNNNNSLQAFPANLFCQAPTRCTWILVLWANMDNGCMPFTNLLVRSYYNAKLVAALVLGGRLRRLLLCSLQSAKFPFLFLLQPCSWLLPVCEQGESEAQDYRVLSIGQDDSLRLWDPFDMTCLRVLKETRSELTALTFFAAGNTPITGGTTVS